MLRDEKRIFQERSYKGLPESRVKRGESVKEETAQFLSTNEKRKRD